MLRPIASTKALYRGAAIVVALLMFNTQARADVLAFFDFNDASDAGVALDSSGNGNHGEIIFAEFTDPGDGRTGQAGDRAMDFGDFNNGAYMDITSALDGAFDSMAETDQVTLTMWVLGGPDNPVNNWTLYAGPDRQLGTHIPWSNSNIYFDVAGTPDDPCCNDRINTVIDFETFMDEWNHYAFVKMEDETSIYQNGELILDGFDMRPMNEITEFYLGIGPSLDNSYHGLIDDFGVWDEAMTEEQINDIMDNGFGGGGDPKLQAGDANMDYEFNQLDLVQVQIAAKYLTGAAADWGEGDWDGAPGGTAGSPPAGDGQFNQLDIISALNADVYLKGDYRALSGLGSIGDDQTSVTYDPGTGELGVDAPAGTELTSINIDSASGIFTGEPAANLGGSFDNDADNNIFKATFGSSFGSLEFGAVAQTGLSEEAVLADLTVVGSLAGGGDLGSVDLIYIPEPSTLLLILLGLVGLVAIRRR